MSSDPLSPSEVTRILQAAESSDPSSLERLFPLVYDELRQLAERQFHREGAGHTLQPTALVHEAYLRVAKSDGAGWKDRAHFVALAAKVMRQILVDHHRRRSASKRGGEAARLTLDPHMRILEQSSLDILALEESLAELAELDERKGRVVELRVFGGLEVEEVAHILEVSPRTVEADWAFARAWLRRKIGEETGSS